MHRARLLRCGAVLLPDRVRGKSRLLWGFAVDQVVIAGSALQGVRIIAPVKCNAWGDRHAFFGIADGGGKHASSPSFPTVFRTGDKMRQRHPER